MSINLTRHLDAYLHLHADCIPVRGALRSAICDLTRNELIFFPTEYYEVLEFLKSDTIGNVLNSLENDEEKKFVIQFIEFLQQHELFSFLKDTSMFPAIEEQWDIPAIIQNAIIDVDAVHHDFDKIFNDLDELGCMFVQIRSFSDLLKLEDISRILTSSHHKSIKSVELILKYDADVADEMYIHLVESQPIISNLTIHSSPEERTLIVDYGCDEETGRYIKKEFQLVTQVINSQSHCGLITLKALSIPSVDNFFENKLFNGCLNRKVSIDVFGEIKNCPSMYNSYGNISGTSLNQAINSDGFKDTWKITKDQVDICRDCEFRYVCTDCRAYVENPDDIYSKPLKCGYNPYSNEWQHWSENPLKQKTFESYVRWGSLKNRGLGPLPQASPQIHSKS